jgi:glycerol-3-phosphate dehydrogenase
VIVTPSGSVTARFVLNAAGVHAGDVAALAGVAGVTIHARKGEEYLLDKRLRGLVQRVIYPCPSATSKGTLVIPTYDGTIMIGPTADEVDDPDDVTTSEAGAERVLAAARRLVPGISERDIIAQFAGVRAVLESEDFLIGPTSAPGFINVAGIQSPGLTAAPAIALLVVESLRDADLELVARSTAGPLERPVHFASMTTDEQARLVDDDPRYGRITCRCEFVTEGEVLDAIGRGARTLDGLKFRTRAGMGRCQGGFCTARCMSLLAAELDLPLSAVTKRGGGSWLVIERGDLRATAPEDGHTR